MRGSVHPQLPLQAVDLRPETVILRTQVLAPLAEVFDLLDLVEALHFVLLDMALRGPRLTVFVVRASDGKDVGAKSARRRGASIIEEGAKLEHRADQVMRVELFACSGSSAPATTVCATALAALGDGPIAIVPLMALLPVQRSLPPATAGLVTTRHGVILRNTLSVQAKPHIGSSAHVVLVMSCVSEGDALPVTPHYCARNPDLPESGKYAVTKNSKGDSTPSGSASASSSRPTPPF